MTAKLVLTSSPPARFHNGWRGPAPWRGSTAGPPSGPAASALPRRCRAWPVCTGRWAWPVLPPVPSPSHTTTHRTTVSPNTLCHEATYLGTPNTLCTNIVHKHCILYTAHYILYTVYKHCTHTLHTLYTSTAYCMLHTTYCILHTNTVHKHTVYKRCVQSTAYCILHTTYILYTNTVHTHCIQTLYTSTVYCMLHTTYCILHTNTVHKHTVYMCTSEHCICVSPRHMHTCWPCLASHWRLNMTASVRLLSTQHFSLQYLQAQSDICRANLGD